MELDEMLKKYSALNEEEVRVEVLPEGAVGVTVEGDSVTTGQDVIQPGGSRDSGGAGAAGGPRGVA